MEPVRVSAGQGARWIGDGWRAFAASPGMWIVLVVLWAVILAAVQFVPFVGAIAGLLIAPALAGGLLLCVRDGLTGHSLDVGRLFDPLTGADTRGPMLVLGALFLVAHLVAMFLAGMLLLATAGMTLFEHADVLMAPGGPRPEAMDPALLMQLGLGAALAALLGVALSLLAWALFFYAIPLVLLAGVEPAAAIGQSVRGVLRNWLSLLVLSVLWMALSILATLPLLLGWLVLLPVTFGAWYASWRDVFPVPVPQRAAGSEDAEPAP